MDDSTVGWSKERYQECTTKLGAFLKGIGYAKDDIIYMPVSGYTGAGLKDRVDQRIVHGMTDLHYWNTWIIWIP